jgi:antitoxin HigA-1
LRWLGWIYADVALRLGKYFGMTPQFWMNLQVNYDLRRQAPARP